MANEVLVVPALGSKNKGAPASEPKRVPKKADEAGSGGENKPIELNILSIQQEDAENKETPKKVNLGEVLELAVQSMSVTMAEEDVEEKNEMTDNFSVAHHDNNIFTLRNSYESADESDFEWKLDNEEDSTVLSPPSKKKKLSANAIVPIVSMIMTFLFIRESSALLTST